MEGRQSRRKKHKFRIPFPEQASKRQSVSQHQKNFAEMPVYITIDQIETLIARYKRGTNENQEKEKKIERRTKLHQEP